MPAAARGFTHSSRFDAGVEEFSSAWKVGSSARERSWRVRQLMTCRNMRSWLVMMQRPSSSTRLAIIPVPGTKGDQNSRVSMPASS